ncbi:MAG: phytanoyl-CoA dioxygenase family protein [Chloroflexi bacterium]|nr:phytanoyl-CoA dioxygenase family protein [Chloroflexota bacterium]
MSQTAHTTRRAHAARSAVRPSDGPLGAVRAKRTLTPDELAAYHADGYVVVPGIFPADELEAIDREIDRLLEIPGNDAGGIHPTWIFQVARRSEMTRQFAEDERLLALAEAVVSPGIAIHSTKLVPKPPHSNDVCHWHQDEAFYLKPDDPETYSRTRMSVWVPLQDADERNGGLWVVPGSHTWGIDPYHMVDTGQCRKVIDREAYADEHAIPLRVAAGSVVLFSAWTWHHSKNNQTDRVRRAFIVSYQEATVRKGAGEQWKLVRPAH